MIVDGKPGFRGPTEISTMRVLVGGIEAGGTKFVCAVGTGPDDVRAETRITTTTPQATIGQSIEFFQAQRARWGPLAAVGIASFGPIDPEPHSPTFGYITSTPKPRWGNADLVGPVRTALGIPVAFDTDVNVAAWGEHCWGGQGPRRLNLLDDRNRNRWRRPGEWPAAARSGASRDGSYSRTT